MSRYTDASFKRDIRQLERLINGFSTRANKSATTMSGGRVARAKSGKRSFRVVSVNGKPTSFGRYTLKEGQDPKAAAARAFRKLCEKRGIKNDKCKLKFSIKETTRGSNHKVHTYEGHKEKLAKPRVAHHGDGRKVVHKYKSVLKAVGQKGGFAFYN